ncbi:MULTISPECIES: solanesyl diphosphate synthase [Prochlorococcus]|uniref:Geranylgeranyl pyrophosphate synthase n=1 Tax=Prochlorococcus marinus (strain SARG / CCMP1375 / SS120) TaxID=167539 RepID=Q7VBQ0_PROMA|nr:MULTISPECIES: solanesyl diphosphate synthase [Prochlorococcus]AAQ00087.1 Geranylgeranyl pyrophosphate synthase [Prochlorococcus marinus subsp. marinus str. CCMP1375]KGG13883.1 Solanesyl diphosphate synthase [Prochlorococcus marinus str. LG]KGG19016.1 Solanesyl diphosphate synthase [Prochlorococcus marinus str. SS2]KGG23444.1 Solanesyl diphosphate synthase [Prochlorococcus marinus str. SS35]KGG32320.1 Solanesyl diphosphate synthase [Prochlorococcus marinus str. SS51]
MATVTELLQPIEIDLEHLLKDLRDLIGAGHPILQAAAEHLFSAGGKRIRPGIVLLISKALSAEGELSSKHRRLAEITEMIHTASLVHDDVLDEASTRRGVDTVHNRFDHKVAVLAGDFLFAQASWHLANLDNLDVVKLLSRVIMDLAEGEVKQGIYRFDPNQSLDVYLEKSYCKTASLIANSAQAVGVLSNESDYHLKCLYNFGKQLGLAFQVVDDILDFTSDDKQLGKPAASDLSAGYLTAPALYALEENPSFKELIIREFSNEGDLDHAMELVRESNAIIRSRKLAENFAKNSYESIKWMPDSPSKRALLDLPEYVLGRLF